MSFTIVILQTGLLKQRPDLEGLRKLFGGAYRVGGVGPFGTFAPEPSPPPDNLDALYMLCGAGKVYAGRGFYLGIQKGFMGFEVSCALPAAEQDLRDVFAFAGLLAEQYNLRDAICDGKPIPAEQLPLAYTKAQAANALGLCSMATAKPGFTVSALRYPVTLTEKLCQRIIDVPVGKGGLYYQSYLNEKQPAGFYYMLPSFTRDDAGDVTALYTLPTGRPSIIPAKPGIPYGPAPFGGAPVGFWLVEFTDEGTPLGRVPYQAFLNTLSEADIAQHDPNTLLLRNLSKRRIQELVRGTT